MYAVHVWTERGENGRRRGEVGVGLGGGGELGESLQTPLFPPRLYCICCCGRTYGEEGRRWTALDDGIL